VSPHNFFFFLLHENVTFLWLCLFNCLLLLLIIIYLLFQLKLSRVPDFPTALSAISTLLHMVVVEHIDNSASLYGCSIKQHHVCLLVKTQVHVGMNFVLIQGCYLF